MSKHTKGPWKIVVGASGTTYIAVDGKGIGLQAVASIESAPEQASADARLIGAAPDLLEVAISSLHLVMDVISQVEMAINEADVKAKQLKLLRAYQMRLAAAITKATEE